MDRAGATPISISCRNSELITSDQDATSTISSALGAFSVKRRNQLVEHFADDIAYHPFLRGRKRLFRIGDDVRNTSDEGLEFEASIGQCAAFVGQFKTARASFAKAHV